MADKSVRIRFAAVDDSSSVINKIVAAMTAMTAKMEAISQRLEAVGNAMGADFSNMSSSSELLESAIQDVAAAEEMLESTSSSMAGEIAAAREEMEANAEAAYEAADADQEVIEAALDLADANAELSGTMMEAQQVQDELTATLERATSAFDELNALEDANAETKERLSNAIETATGAQERLAAAQAEAASAQEYANQIIESGTASLDEIQSATERVNAANEELADAAQEAANANDELADATTDAESEIERLNGTVPEAAENIRNLLEAFGLAVGLKEFVEYLGQCVEKSAEFGEGLAKVSTIADTSKVSMDELRAGIMDISNETGDSVNGLTDALYQALSASVDTADAVEFTATATKLATGGFTEQATAVDILTTTLNAYGMQASEAESISDMLITTQNLGKTTVDELAQAMGRVIPVAAAYNVGMDNLTAGYAELTKGGIATAEATTYLRGMLNELASESSDVSAILREQTGQSFSELMESGMSLGDVMQILGDSVDGNATAFANLWSSQEAGTGALALYNAGAEQFNTTLGAMQNSAGATADAFNTMENTTADALGDMQNAFDNLGIAIGDAMTPLAEFGAGILTFIVEQITAFATACPEATAAILAAAAAVGVAAVAFKVLGDTINMSFPILALISAAVAGITALVIALANNVDEETKKFNEATPAAKQYGDTLHELEDAYDAAAESGVYTAEQLEEMAAGVEEARAEYELMYQTMDEFTASVDNVCEASATLNSNLREQMSMIGQQPALAEAYISRLQELGSQSERTAGQQTLMEGLVSQLNGMYPELAASVDDFTDATGESADAIRDQIDAFNDIQALEQYNQMLSEAQEQMAELAVKQEVAQQQLAAAQERYANASLWDKAPWGQATKDLEAAEQAVADLDSEADNLQSTIDVLEGHVEDLGSSMQDMADEAGDAFDSLSSAAQGDILAVGLWDAYAEEIGTVCAAYDEAAAAAEESFLRQANAFNALEADVSTSLSDAVNNFSTSIDTLNSYSDNLTTVQTALREQYGLTAEQAQIVLDQINSGTPEAIGMAGQLASAMQEGSGEAQAFIDGALGVADAAHNAGQAAADAQTQATEALEQIKISAEGVLTGLDGVSEEAKGKALEAFSNYIAGITESTEGAVSAAETVGQQAGESAAAALGESGAECGNVMSDICRKIEQTAASCNPKIVVQVDTSAADAAISRIRTNATNIKANVTGNARGTRFSLDDVYIAGEEGPELIIGGYGSRVYTAPETADILDALNRFNQPRMPMDPMGNVRSAFEWDVAENPLVSQADEDIARTLLPVVEIKNDFSALSRWPVRDDERIDRMMLPNGQWAPVKDDDERRLDMELPDTPPPRERPRYEAHDERPAPAQTQRIEITLNGTGAIRTDKGVDKAAIVAAVMKQIQSKLPGVIIDMLQEESFQEGDRTYAL